MPITDRSLSSGTVLVAKYKGREHRATVGKGENGKIRYRLADGREFRSPSAAGKAITGTACNGWRFWGVAGDAGAATQATRGATSADTAPTRPARPHGPDCGETRRQRADRRHVGQTARCGEGQRQQGDAYRRQAHAQGHEALIAVFEPHPRAGADGRLLLFSSEPAHDGGIVAVTKGPASRGNCG